MMPWGPPAPPVGGGTPPLPPSLLRSNSSNSLGLTQQQQQQQQFSSIAGGAPPLPPSLLRSSSSNSLGLTQQQQQQQFSATMLSPRPPVNGGGLSSMGTPINIEQQQLQNQQQIHQGNVNVSNLTTVKLEPQTTPTQNGPVKIEPSQMPPLRNLGPVKLENQHQDSPSIQQQHQRLLQLSRQSSSAAAAVQMNLLQQQRLLQLQQQRSQLQQQGIVNVARPQGKYEPGTCMRRLTLYMQHQRQRQEDNSIEYWRRFVREYFAPNAKKRWCFSLYGGGRQTFGVFPQDVWHCDICNRKPGRGFETTVEVLPRLFQIKYASGTLDELLYVDMPREQQNASGQIVLDYAKAIQESVFEQLRVVREGQLRIVFSLDLKIVSWEFCARRHEELIPRRLLVPQVNQLRGAVQKYQASGQNGSAELSTQELQSTCNSFVASARQIAKALEVPLVNDLGYTKRYVRCLQISEVVNCMKDLIDYSRETGTGPLDSLINFPRRIPRPLPSQQPPQQSQEQKPLSQNLSNNDPNSCQATSNGFLNASNSMNVQPPSTSQVTSIGLQNSSSPKEPNTSSGNNNYTGVNTMQMPSANSSGSQSLAQPNLTSSPFPSSLPPTPKNLPPSVSLMQNPTALLHGDLSDSQSSVQRILQEMMSSSKVDGMNSIGNGLKNVGISPLNHGNSVMNGIGTDSGACRIEPRKTNNIGGLSTLNGQRQGMMHNNDVLLNGSGAMNYTPKNSLDMNHWQQHDIGDQLLGALQNGNTFNNPQFDWKSSP